MGVIKRPMRTGIHPVLIIELDDTFLKCIKPGLDKYLICNKNGELYKSSSSFAKFFKNTFSYKCVVADMTHNLANKTTETPSFSKD